MEIEKVLFIGDQWFGSDARSLAFAFRRAGKIVSTVDPNLFFPRSTKFVSRVLNRLITPLYIGEYNQAILRADTLLNADVVVVFKGWGVSPKTLDVLRHRNRTLVQFYPDTTLYAYGKWIPECVSKYDYWFTTKSFGIDDVKTLSSSVEVIAVNHAFDPDVHAPPKPESWKSQKYSCDVSFIGTWDLEKEQFLAEVAQRLPEINMKIWGSYWERSTREELVGAIQGCEVLGDLYTLSMQQSRINLGLLRKRLKGGASGDQVTARTFQIPAVGGFMLHQRTKEATDLFKEGVHAAYFQGVSELAEKIGYYLANPDERERTRRDGHLECVRCHCMDRRAEVILETLARRQKRNNKEVVDRITKHEG